jgi:hypothetical protein
VVALDYAELALSYGSVSPAFFNAADPYVPVTFIHAVVFPEQLPAAVNTTQATLTIQHLGELHSPLAVGGCQLGGVAKEFSAGVSAEYADDALELTLPAGAIQPGAALTLVCDAIPRRSGRGPLLVTVAVDGTPGWQWRGPSAAIYGAGPAVLLVHANVRLPTHATPAQVATIVAATTRGVQSATAAFPSLSAAAVSLRGLGVAETKDGFVHTVALGLDGVDAFESAAQLAIVSTNFTAADAETRARVAKAAGVEEGAVLVESSFVGFAVEPQHCGDQVADPSVEAGVDCGRECAPCPAQQPCSADEDCASLRCERDSVFFRGTCAGGAEVAELGSNAAAGTWTATAMAVAAAAGVLATVL